MTKRLIDDELNEIKKFFDSSNGTQEEKGFYNFKKNLWDGAYQEKTLLKIAKSINNCYTAGDGLAVVEVQAYLAFKDSQKTKKSAIIAFISAVASIVGCIITLLSCFKHYL